MKILKKIPAEGGGISFSSHLFVDEMEEFLLPENTGTVSLCYKDAGKSKELSKFIPVIISLPEFTKQLLLLRENLPKKNKDVIDREIYNHFINNYGFINAGLLQKIIKKHVNQIR